MSAVERAVAAFGRGEMVVVTDDRDRENEADLMFAGQHADAEKVAFMLRHTSGFICVSMAPERVDELGLPMMVDRNTSPYSTPFTVTVDSRHGISTGISAHDRARTISVLSNPATTADDLTQPGHIHILRSRPGGVKERNGHTEAGVELARLAGCEPVTVLCELVSEDKLDMARGQEVIAFAEAHGLPVVSIAELGAHTVGESVTASEVAYTDVALPTKFGSMRAFTADNGDDAARHLVLRTADLPAENALVRIHSECLTGDVFGSLRCDCGEQLDQSLQRINDEGAGVVIYLRGHEGRGIGIERKLQAYALQEQGLDTVDANVALGLPVDDREYGDAAKILLNLGIHSVRLLSNNPLKQQSLLEYGLQVTEMVPIRVAANEHNRSYLRTKRERMGHLMEELNAEDN